MDDDVEKFLDESIKKVIGVLQGGQDLDRKALRDYCQNDMRMAVILLKDVTAILKAPDDEIRRKIMNKWL